MKQKNTNILEIKAENILDKQQESAKRTYIKHPELDISKRQSELLKEGKSKDEIAAINEKFRQQEEAITDEYNARIQQKELEIAKTNLENKLAVAATLSEEELNLKTQALEAQRVAEVAAAEKSGADVALVNAKYDKMQEDLNAQTLENRLSATSSALGQISGMFEKNTVAYKVTASAQALIDTYKAANAAFSSLAGIPVVGPALGAAAAAAAVVAGIKQVQAINSTQVPKAQKFATGGIVGGTSYTGDKVPAYVNSGEMILNAKQQENLFKFVQNPIQSNGFDYGKLANAMSNIKPQVAVTEIKNVSSRVDVLENLGAY